VHPPQRQDKITSSRPKVIMTAMVLLASSMVPSPSIC
jgi:hypothetical protein